MLSLIDKARKNRDINVVSQINTSCQGVAYNVDYNAMMKEFQNCPTLHKDDSTLYAYACIKLYVNTPDISSDGNMTWDEYFDFWEKRSAFYRKTHPVTISCLSQALPEGVPYMAKYNLRLYVGLTKDRQGVYIKAVTCDFDTGKVVLDGEKLSDEDSLKYKDSILNCYYSWKFKK